MRYKEEDKPSTGRPEQEKRSKITKKVSKEVGEYVDYEEVDK